MTLFVQLLLSGLMSGAVYALLAMGMVISFRASQVPNLAHGEAFAAAGLVTASASSAGLALPAAMLLGLATGAAMAVTVELVILRPRSSWSVPALLLATLGFAFLSRGVLILVFGSDPLSFAAITSAPPVRFAGAAIQMQGVILIVCALVACIGVYLLLRHTQLGLRLRASALNSDAAQLMGIDVKTTRLIAFLLAGLMAGLAALLLIPLTSVDFQTGLGMTLRGFIAAALAGMSETRAILSGLTLGLLEGIVGGYAGALFQDPIVFAGLIAVALLQSRKLRYGGVGRA